MSQPDLDSIKDLLPNEHLLNFHAGTPTLPEWLGDSLKIILGAGDFNQHGISNVEKFNMFDVFFCMPFDVAGSLRENVDYLLKAYDKKKVICFLDIQKPEQVESFCTLFKNRFTLVDGYGGHTPHLPMECIQKILKVGGTAVNLYESGPGFYHTQLSSILNKKVNEITKSDAEIMLGKLLLPPSMNNTSKQTIYRSFNKRLDQYIREKLKTNTSITMDWSIVPQELEGKEKFPLLAKALAVLYLYDPLPTGLKGTFQSSVRIWDPARTFHELVVTKVQEGGKKKRRKTKKAKRSTRKNHK